eukprot:2939728-Prorocentrum_lima.AAC.1
MLMVLIAAVACSTLTCSTRSFARRDRTGCIATMPSQPCSRATCSLQVLRSGARHAYPSSTRSGSL